MQRSASGFGAANGGNVALAFAIAAPMVIGSAALMAETSFDYAEHNHLQAAADAAAYAGALDNRAGASASSITAAATDVAKANGWSSASGTIQVNSPPASGSHTTSNAVEVILTNQPPRFFSALFNSTPITIKARAVAVFQKASNACVLALNKTASKAIEVQGNASMTLDGCDVVSNSTASDGIFAWGSSQMSAACVASAGGVNSKGNITLTGCPSVITQAPRTRDPFADLTPPSPGASQTIPKGGKGTTTLSPGYYGSGMDLKGTIALDPGTYYVSGGDFNINGNTTVTGSGVTIYLESGSQVTMNGNADVTLSAPTSGTYAGLLFYGDPGSTGGINKFNGSASSHLTGNLYFPTQEVDFKGNFSGSGGCMHLVADTVVWTGSSTMDVDCSAAGLAEIPALQTIRVVE